MSKTEFIESIAKYVAKYAGNYSIKIYSPIIAQAILESGWGESRLAYQYHNYFGLKCGTKWTGKSVNMSTQEEYTAGTMTTITDNFRVYDSMEDGVKGYFEFIQLTRYQNLKGITDCRQYLETIKNDGYATSSTYVDSLMKLVNQYNLTQFDSVSVTESEDKNMASRGAASAWLAQYEGCSEGSTSHRHILDVYNNSGLCTRYKMTVNDAWCATATSAAFIATGLASIFPCVECSCENMINLAKAAGIWVENDAYVPKTDDVILYDWDDSGAGDCTGWSDHVGIVVSCNGSTIRVIEGNKNNTVGYRTLAVNGRYIRGFITPRFSASSTGNVNTGTTSGGSGNSLNKSTKFVGVVNADELNVRTWAGTSNPTCSFSPLAQGTEIDVCDEVSGWYYIKYSGKYGFVSADYVTKKVTTSAPTIAPTTSGAPDKNPKWTGKVTADVLNVRTWAGTENARLKSYPTLSEGNLVDVCDTVKASNGDYWYYIRIAGKVYGFVHSAYITQA